MNAIVTIAILSEVLRPKLIFTKHLNCASLCLFKRHDHVYCILSSAHTA